MSESKHTPGPWRVTKRHVVGPVISSDDQSNGMVAGVCDVYGDNRNQDARLIAAAPDLLEALHVVGMSAGWQYLTMETRALVEAAMAKAEGRS